MILLKSKSFALVPFIIAGGTLAVTMFVLAINLINVRSVTPVAMVPGAARSDVVAPLRIDQEYGKAVADAFLKAHFVWTPETWNSQMRAAVAFVDPPLQQMFWAKWIENHALIRATGEGQYAFFSEAAVYDFDPDVGISLVYPVRVEKFYQGLSYKTLNYRVTVALNVREPNNFYPYALRVTAFRVDNLTEELFQ